MKIFVHECAKFAPDPTGSSRRSIDPYLAGEWVNLLPIPTPTPPSVSFSAPRPLNLLLDLATLTTAFNPHIALGDTVRQSPAQFLSQ